MNRSVLNKYYLIFICLLVLSCSGTRHLPQGEKLYTNAKIRLDTKHKINTRLIKTNVEGALRPAPNHVYLGMHPQLWMYQHAGDEPKSRIGKWLKKNGEAPVLLSSLKPGATAAIIDARLFNTGIFKSNTEFEIIEKTHTASVIYTSHIQEQYTIKTLNYSVSDDNLGKLIEANQKESLIKPGEAYNLDILKFERIRIDAFLKDNGYFYFNPEYILFKADTVAAYHTVTLNLTIKENIPKSALTVYRIKKVLIDQDFSLHKDEAEAGRKSFVTQNSEFLEDESEMSLRPKELLRSVYLRKDEIFSRKNHIITLNRLMSLENFKFVRIKFADSDTTANGFLDVTIFLTPMSKHTMRSEMDIVTKSNNYTGPRLNVGFLNRNSFRGAELLNLNLATSFEGQLGGNSKNGFSYFFNPQLELTFPRFLLPFKIRNISSIYTPKTFCSLSYNYLKRVSYFDMRTFQFVYSYKWKPDIRIEHEFNPINVSYSSIGNKSAAFIEMLDANPYLKKGYEEQFIAGGSYSFTFNEQVLPAKKMQYYFHLTSEFAGNAFSLAKRILGEDVSQDNPSVIAGSVYAQFAKLSLEGRGYYNLPDKNKLALRVFAGVARPFGNSSVLPYSKEFFSGGPNSIRAFQINSLGPGSYYQDPVKNGFLQLGGDLKLEMNSEYRFTIYRYFKGALFVDAGNIWLLKSNPTKLGNPFSLSGFTKDLAVGTGFGLRVDLSFFILRFDLAMPLRKPWFEENHRWVTNQINFVNSTWRGENLIFNVAIGYPF